MRNEGESGEQELHAQQAKPPRRAGHVRAVLARLGVVVAVLAVAATSIWAVTRASTLKQSPTTLDIPALSVKAAQVKPGSVVPINATLKGAPKAKKSSDKPQARTGEQQLAAWADRVGPAIGVPPRALVAYGKAEVATRQSNPACNLSWATLAGIGRIESNHGQYGGAVLGADGRPSIPIIGVPLNGTGRVRAIGDTDGGRYDGDTKWDRAVGPMQFIPSTWARYASDGNGDGVGDPQHIDDAALAAARYLCVGGRDMASAEGWWAGILSYNRSVEYAQKVFGVADQYAKLARGIGY